MKKLTKVMAFAMCLIMLMSTCSAMIINAYAATAPKFSLVETAKTDTTVTYEFRLDSGSFNAIDFCFRTSGAVCTSIAIAPELGAGVANVATGIVSSANTTAYSKAGGTVATATFTITGASYSVNVDVTNCVITEGKENINVTRSVSVQQNETESWFIRLLKAIVNFFIKIIDFISGLFATAA